MSSVQFTDSDSKNVGGGDKTKGRKKEKRHSKQDKIISYEDLLADGDKTKQVLLQKKEKAHDKIMALVLKETIVQRLAGIHLQSLNNYALFFPTMLITLLSAAISILLTSELIGSQESKIKLGIVVAFLQLILSIFQSLSKQLNFGGRAGQHESASRSLSNMYHEEKALRDEKRYNAIYKAIKTNTKLEVGANTISKDDDETKTDKNEDESVETAPNEKENGGDDDDDDKDGQTGGTSLTGKYKQTLEQADAQVPYRISSAFDMMESRITIINKSLSTDKTSALVMWEKLLPALYYQLSETIIESFCWPFFVPSPRHSVERALKRFKEDFQNESNNADLLVSLLDRADDIRHAQTIMSDKKKLKTLSERSTYSDFPMMDTTNDDSQVRASSYGSIV